ncbi:MAG: hypothetical protein AAFZ15_06190 [Bacteroidota bacterium]
MRYLFFSLLFYFLISSNVYAQYEKLKNDSNITWVAEFQLAYDFDLRQEGNKASSITLNKFVSGQGIKATKTTNWLPKTLLKNIISGKIRSYKAPDFSSQYTPQEIEERINSRDTLPDFTACYGFHFHVFHHSIENLKYCLTKQALYFDRRTGTIGTYLIAVAPATTDRRGTNHSYLPFAWVKSDDAWPNKHSVDDTAIHLAWTSDNNTTLVHKNSFQVVKGELDFNQFITDRELAKKSMIFDESDGFPLTNVLSEEDMDSILAGHLDTIFTFDAEKYEEEIELYQKKIQPGDIDYFRLVQDWYFLPEKDMVANQLKAIVPIAMVRDYYHQNRYNNILRHLYFVKTE